MNTMKNLIDCLINEKAKGNSFQEMNYTMKLMLKGVPVKNIDSNTPNDPHIISKIEQAALEFNLSLNECLRR